MIIATTLYDGQGLGNQLWVYAAARSIAEYHNCGFVLIGAARFKGAGFLHIANEVGISAAEAARVTKLAEWKNFHEFFYYDPDLDYASSGFDSRVLALNGINKLDGLFQSEKYFFGDLDKPKSYFILDDEWMAKNPVPDDTCIINLRGGEYKRHKSLILPKSYWNTAIENMKRMTVVRRFLVVTDDVRYARAMFPGYDVLEGGVGDCYARIYNAKYLILSNSSFAYFPVKTGKNGKCVIAPRYWSRYGNPYGRWASIANLYTSWLWQSPDGQLSTFEECLPELEATEAEYESRYFVRTTMGRAQKPGIRRLVPVPVRIMAKRLLSLVAPKSFG